MDFAPGIYVIDYSKNYVARTTKYTGVVNGRKKTYTLVHGAICPNSDFINHMSLFFGPNILIANHEAMEGLLKNPHVQKCKQMAENMAAFRLEGDGDGAIWHRVRSFYIGDAAI